MQAIKSTEAWVAIDKTGFVDGACIAHSEDTESWISPMQEAGFTVEVRDRAEAKKILFTYIERHVSVLEA